jgi:putative mRNA 3-end processing factor
MTLPPVDVTAYGAVQLGTDIVCDGFHFGAAARIQTHVHDDHMEDFEKSKGFQYLYMSEATKKLLIAERNADLPYRDNVRSLSHGTTAEHRGATIQLFPNSHMLGSVQALVETTDGARLGYSGDFAWPLDDVIQVDGLVVDSTYGAPGFRKEYTQAEAESRFVELVLSRLLSGPVHVIAHRGTLHRSLQLLSGQLQCPLLGSKRLCREVEVYRSMGCCIDDIVEVNSAVGRSIGASSRYVRFYGKGDQYPKEHIAGSRVVLSAFMSRPDDPVLSYSRTSFRVALTDHADFDGTLDYVRATGARYVVTDNTRSGNGIVLAQEISARLGIKARPSSNVGGYEWGG